ncbi:MAG: hypothetical protein AAGA30_18100 [Planctomycetota bacterium]
MEELYDMRMLSSGAHKSTRNFNLFWIEFGKNEIHELAADQETLHLSKELRNTLSHLLELEKASAEAAVLNYENELQLHLELIEYNNSLSNAAGGSIAREVFDVLGPEYCRRRFAEEISSELKHYVVNSKLLSSYTMTSELQNARFASALNLKDEQRAQIESAVSVIAKQFKDSIFEIFEELSALSNQRWKRLLNTLNPNQRVAVQKFIGTPVEWFRELDHSLKKNLLENARNSWAGENALRFAEKNNIEINELASTLTKMSPKEIATIGLEVFDPLEQSLIFNEPIQKQLELIDDQIQKLKDSIIRIQDNQLQTTTKGRFTTLLNGTPKQSLLAQEILLPHQLKRLGQIELQTRTDSKYDGSVGLLDPRIIAHLEINKEQRSEIKEIGDQFEKDQKVKLQRIYKIYHQCRKEMEQDVAAVLDEQQKNLFRDFTGREIGKTKTSTHD